MKEFKLSTKFLLASVLILVVFCMASVGILFQAQSLQAEQEMDQLLKNETLALSALVNTSTSGSFDFEMSPLFLSQYSEHNPNAFFRFLSLNGKDVLKESAGSPAIECRSEVSKTAKVSEIDYRVKTFRFRPEVEGDPQTAQGFVAPLICLVVGLDQAPYQAMIRHTLMVSVPALMVIFILLISFMFILIRRLTRDLSILTMSLTTADFSATHAFPALPTMNTPEIKAVVEKLEGLHAQAAEVYRGMWLFLGRAAHQIRTPVTAMQTTLDVLLRKERSRDELLAGLDDVKSAATLLSALTKKLILSSRISFQEDPPEEIVDLDNFFSELVGLFRSQADELGVRINLGPTTAVGVVGNRSLMSDVFGNLIENAVLYSPKAKRATVTITWWYNDENVFIEVSDQGEGFPKEVIAALFEPFIRGDESRIAGSGLGLSIAKKSVHLMKGEIDLKASTPSGSKIVVTLPAAIC